MKGSSAHTQQLSEDTASTGLDQADAGCGRSSSSTRVWGPPPDEAVLFAQLRRHGRVLAEAAGLGQEWPKVQALLEMAEQDPDGWEACTGGLSM